MKEFALLEYYLYLTATTRSNLSLPDAPAGVEVFFDLFTKSQILMIGFILGRFTDIPTRVLVKEDRTHTHTFTRRSLGEGGRMLSLSLQQESAPF